MTVASRAVRAVGAALVAVAVLAPGARWLFAGGPDSPWHQLLAQLGVPNSCRLVLDSQELDPADFRITFYSENGSRTVFDGRSYQPFPGVYGSSGFLVDYRGQRVFGSNDFSPKLGGNRYWIRCRSELEGVRCRDHLEGAKVERAGANEGHGR